MKTYNTTASRILSILAAIIIGLNFTSCTAEDEPMVADTQKVTDAQITFTYTVPQELFRYAEITVCYNNNEGTDACWQPMLDNKFTVTYNLSKFPVTAPVVMVYDTTNRPAFGTSVNWDITMDVEVTMTVGGQKVTKTNFETYTIDGDLGAAIVEMQRDVHTRTYAVKLAKNGEIQFI